jgi:hypothetical protein
LNQLASARHKVSDSCLNGAVSNLYSHTLTPKQKSNSALLDMIGTCTDDNKEQDIFETYMMIKSMKPEKPIKPPKMKRSCNHDGS